MESGNIGILTLSVEGQQISGKGALRLKREEGSEDPSFLYFTFSKDWDDFTREIRFKKRFRNDIYQFALTSDGCQIPDEMLEDDEQFVVGIYGEKDNQRKPTTWSPPISIVMVRNNDSKNLRSTY